MSAHIISLNQALPAIDWHSLVAGIDEAGRGPLAGPVSASAVILDPANPIDGLDDSKALSESRREQLAEQIEKQALSWSVSFVESSEIDQLNILHATMAAMRRAVLALDQAPQLALVDGNRLPQLDCVAYAIIKGDARVACISAASILAKVYRDRRMRELDQRFPEYGFAQHKGYPTPAHKKALTVHGPIAEHRRSFAPVRAALQGRT